MKKTILSAILMLAINVICSAGLPEWAYGKWSDGSCIIEISPSKITVYEGNKVVDETISYEYEPPFISAEWKNGFADALIISGNSVAIEGGDALKKVGGLSMPKGLAWLAGKWSDGTNVYTITPVKITMSKGGKVLNTGTYNIDGEILEPVWEKAYNGDLFILFPEQKRLGIEGAGWMKKIG